MKEQYIIHTARRMMAYIISLVVCSLIGCAKKVTTKMEENTNISHFTADSLSINKNELSSAISVTLEDGWWEEEFTLVEYSKPDSCGNQYIKAEKKGKRTGGVAKKDSTTISTNSAIQTEQKTTNDINVSKQTKTKTTKDDSPLLMWLKIGGGCLAVVILIFIVVWIKKKGFY